MFQLPDIKRRKFFSHYILPSSLFLIFGRLQAKCALIGESELAPSNQNYLALNRSFTAHVIRSMGDALSDGYLTPGYPDGMGVFPLNDDECILMCNHELELTGWKFSGFAKGSAKNSYDEKAPGGVTRIVYNFKQHRVVSSNFVLMGTVRNCSGGYSPYGWFSCEETLAHKHGFVFLCDPYASDVQPPNILPALGKMTHEGCVMDPETRISYLTEDTGDSCFYRFVPKNPEHPFEGQLEALQVKKNSRPVPHADLIKPGELLEVSWIPVLSRVADLDDTTELGCSLLGSGATTFRRGEGIFLGSEGVFFSCSTGGDAKLGQIFCLNPKAGANGLIGLVHETKDTSAMNMPDNITCTPWGDVYIAEDNDDECHIKVLKKDGTIKVLASNPNRNSEFAGLCFSPDYKTLFVNMQKLHKTFAIRGDFSKF